MSGGDWIEGLVGGEGERISKVVTEPACRENKRPFCAILVGWDGRGELNGFTPGGEMGSWGERKKGRRGEGEGSMLEWRGGEEVMLDWRGGEAEEEGSLLMGRKGGSKLGVEGREEVLGSVGE